MSLPCHAMPIEPNAYASLHSASLPRTWFLCDVLFVPRLALLYGKTTGGKISGSFMQVQASPGGFSAAMSSTGLRRRNMGRRGVGEETSCIKGDPEDKEHGEDIIYGAAIGDSEVHWCYDDSSFCQEVDSNANCIETDLYDGIRGAFWSNDPYYQELEALNEMRKIDNAERPEKVLGSLEAPKSYGVETRPCCGQIDDSLRCLDHVPECNTQDDSVAVGFRQGQIPLSSKLDSSHGKILNGIRQNAALNCCKISDNQTAQSRHCKLRAMEMQCIQNRGPSHSAQSLQNICDVHVGLPSSQGIDFSLELGMEQAVQVMDQVEEVPVQITHAAVQVPSKVVDQVVEQIPVQVSQAAEVVSKVLDEVMDVLPNPLVEQVGQAAGQVSVAAEQLVQVASHVVDPVAAKASEIVSHLSADQDGQESDNEFEAYTSSDMREFKGKQGLNNFTVLQEDHGILSIIYDIYIYMLKKSLPEFAFGMFAAPILLSCIFTLLYLPQFDGLALDEIAQDFLTENAKSGAARLKMSWGAVFEVFMFSMSLATGLQPELTPLSPYTLMVANINALIAQLIFVFLSGAVFSRLSQPSQPVKCSSVALICPNSSNRRLSIEGCYYKSFLARYVLMGPQPMELIDVKVDLMYKYNIITRSGTYFRQSQSLKLVRPEISFLNYGMVVRHIIDETSPLYHRTWEMLEKEDAIFTLSMVGLERSSMQSVFHMQHYCVFNGDVIWDAEFEDMILINKKNRRVVDHSRLSKWKHVTVTEA